MHFKDFAGVMGYIVGGESYINTYYTSDIFWTDFMVTTTWKKT